MSWDSIYQDMESFSLRQRLAVLEQALRIDCEVLASVGGILIDDNKGNMLRIKEVDEILKHKIKEAAKRLGIEPNSLGLVE